MFTKILDRVFAYAPARVNNHRHELERITRFIIIGGASFVFNYLLYAVISRLLWPQGNRTLENFIATSITCVLNYLGHRAWTFRSQGAHSVEATRYIMVAMSGIALQSFLFWIGYRWLGLHDLLVLFFVAIIIPFYTYLAHKFFTFRAAHAACSAKTDI